MPRVRVVLQSPQNCLASANLANPDEHHDPACAKRACEHENPHITAKAESYKRSQHGSRDADVDHPSELIDEAFERPNRVVHLQDIDSLARVLKSAEP